MNYREKIRKAIECPQLNNVVRYGEWGALTLEQRKYIKRLLDELDNADDYCKRVYLENQGLKKQLEDYKEQVNKGLYNTCLPYITGYNKAIKDKENQQKEFIKYLEDGIEQYTPSLRWKHYNEDGFNDYDVENPSCIEVQPTDKIFKEILQKYKSIIGGKE